MNPLRTTVALVLAAALAHPAASVLAKSPKGKANHGAIAVNRDTKAVGYAYDFKTAQEAKREALKRCGEGKCEVLASFKNGCAAIAGGQNKSMAMTGVTRDEAETRVLRKCGKDCTVLAWACTR
jgi:Domain of unknown function (DUF4189)